MRATLLPSEVGGLGEVLGQALVDAVGEEDPGSPSGAFVHDTGILELLNQRLFASEITELSAW
jgi:hypothetical protein